MAGAMDPTRIQTNQGGNQVKPNWKPNRMYSATLTRVVDGDTIQVQWIEEELPTPATDQIRLARIDAPELTGPQAREGLAAKQSLEILLFNRKIRIYPTRKHPDPYGRMIAEVTAAHFNCSNAQMSSGNAIPWRQNHKPGTGAPGHRPHVPLTHRVKWSK